MRNAKRGPKTDEVENTRRVLTAPIILNAATENKVVVANEAASIMINGRECNGTANEEEAARNRRVAAPPNRFLYFATMETPAL